MTTTSPWLHRTHTRLTLDDGPAMLDRLQEGGVPANLTCRGHIELPDNYTLVWSIDWSTWVCDLPGVPLGRVATWRDVGVLVAVLSLDLDDEAKRIRTELVIATRLFLERMSGITWTCGARIRGAAGCLVPMDTDPEFRVEGDDLVELAAKVNRLTGELLRAIKAGREG